MSEEASIPPAQAAPTSAHVAPARELSDAEVVSKHLAISAMNERRNELTLPSLLPPEVLALVFSFLVTVAPISIASVDSDRQRTMGWVSVSHVCRRWRNVCLSQPSLWTRLTPDQHQPWKIFLERAKEASLFIEGRLKYRRDGTTRIQSILDHRHHIQELTLFGVHTSQLQELVDGLKEPLHRLRVLSLSLSRPSQSYNSRPSLPAGFLSNSGRNIQQLTLCGVLFPWGEGSPRITKFVYQHGFTSHASSQQLSHRHTYLDVVQTLRQMPALKTLTLFNVLPEPSAVELNAEVISLPLLQELNLKDANDSCWYLWSQLRFPSGVFLSVQGTRTTTVESLIVSTFRSHLQKSPNPAFSAMSIQLPMSTRGTVSFVLSAPQWPDDQMNDLHIPSHLRRPRSSITLHVSCNVAAEMAKNLISGAALKDIRALTCAGGRIGDTEVFHHTFLPARSVTDLTLKQCAAGPSLAALVIEPANSIGPSSSQPENRTLASPERILFPDLRVMTCLAVDFAARIPYAGAITSTYDVLDKVLDSRSNSGLILETLRVGRCDVSKDRVDGWRDFAEEVNWDLDERGLAKPKKEVGGLQILCRKPARHVWSGSIAQ